MTTEGTTMTPTLTKTRSTLLTPEETARAAAGIKLLGASMGFTNYTTMHARLVAAGYPGSYATFTRLLGATRVAQRSEIELIARFFNVPTRGLTGTTVNPVKDPAPARLIEFDVPRPAVVEGPAKLLPLPAMRRPVKAPPAPPVPSGDVLALAEAVAGLTAAVRELAELQRPTVGLAQVG